MSDISASGKPVSWRPGPATFATGTIALVAISVGAGAFLLGDRGQAARASIGDALQIELVAPIETTPEAGEVMDVGEVNDGFVYVRAQMQPEALEPAEEYWVDEPTYVESWPSMERGELEPYPVAVVNRPASPAPEPVIIDDNRSFGFDAPRRDYQAEREARRARLDALAERSSERTRDWAVRNPAPPTEDIRLSESTFY